jgi:rubredoxin
MTELTGQVVDEGGTPLEGTRVHPYETRLLTTRSLRAFSAPRTTSSPVGQVDRGDLPVLEIKPGGARDSDFVRVASAALPSSGGWICSRWRDSHYALLFDRRVRGVVALTDDDGRFGLTLPSSGTVEPLYRLRAQHDGHYDGESVRGHPALDFGLTLKRVQDPVSERRLVGLLHHFKGWYYTPKRPQLDVRFTPQYPFDIGISVVKETGHPSPPTYDDCVSFVEALVVRAWKDAATPGFSWDLSRHNRSMITDTSQLFSPVDVLVDNDLADAVDDSAIPPPWTVIQGWRDKTRLKLGGHTFIVVDVHKETGRVLTLESNLTYNLNGPGMRMLGNVDRFLRTAFLCPTDGYVYDPALGDPPHGVPAGTPFLAATLWDLVRRASVPADWVCPGCGTSKALFTPYCRPPEHWWENPFLQTWQDITRYYKDRRLARLHVRELAWGR